IAWQLADSVDLNAHDPRPRCDLRGIDRIHGLKHEARNAGARRQRARLQFLKAGPAAASSSVRAGAAATLAGKIPMDGVGGIGFHTIDLKDSLVRILTYLYRYASRLS